MFLIWVGDYPVILFFSGGAQKSHFLVLVNNFLKIHLWDWNGQKMICGWYLDLFENIILTLGTQSNFKKFSCARRKLTHENALFNYPYDYIWNDFFDKKWENWPNAKNFVIVVWITEFWTRVYSQLFDWLNIQEI